MATIENIHIPNAMREVTLHVRVTGRKRANVRVWLGANLIKLAACIIGCGVEIEADR